MSIANLDELVPAEEVFDPIEREREEWLAKRSGRITNSNFTKLIGEGRGKDAVFTQTGVAYLQSVVAERLGSWHATDSPAMKWGRENEPKAIDSYRQHSELEVDSSPFQFFLLTDDIGGTPGAIVGEDGTLEVKCPYNPATHVSTLISREVPKEYVWQVHGHILVTGRQWCDFVSFDPRIPESDPRRICVIRVERDDERLKFLRNRLDLAVAEVERMVQATLGDAA